MPSTTDDRATRAARGPVFTLTTRLGPLAALLFLAACVPGGMTGTSPLTQASAPPSAPVPVAPMRISFTPVIIEPTPAAVEPDARYEALDLSLAREVGLGSWYGKRFHGRRTSSGEKFDQHDLTAAHKTLPFGSKVRVTNVANGKSVEVRITDRGPRSRNRVIDISHAAAMAIDLKRQGVGMVQVDLMPDDGDSAVAQSGPRLGRSVN